MSATASLHLDLLERNYAHEGVAAPAQDEQVMLWVGTALSIAGVPLLIGEGELEEVIETPAYTAIPGTKPWVMGIASHKGGLLPVLSGDVLFRKTAYSGRPREYCIVIRRPGFHFALTLSGIQRDMKFPIEERDMESLVDEDFARFCLGGYQSGDDFLAVLDIDKLVADGDVANAAATHGDSNEDKTDD